eukprot:5947661-Alexandrium_andersonii.AAC.1
MPRVSWASTRPPIWRSSCWPIGMGSAVHRAISDIGVPPLRFGNSAALPAASPANGASGQPRGGRDRSFGHHDVLMHSGGGGQVRSGKRERNGGKA